ncbi:ccdc135, partial [Symbiodinium necroappetens]
DGAVLRTALRRKHATYPELADGRAQALCVLGCEVGGRWSTDAVMLVRRLVALRALKAPPAMRAPAKAAWACRWWSVLSVAVQQAVGHTALGRARAMPGPAHTDAPDLSEVLDLADPEGPSRLPLCG